MHRRRHGILAPTTGKWEGDKEDHAANLVTETRRLYRLGGKEAPAFQESRLSKKDVVRLDQELANYMKQFGQAFGRMEQEGRSRANVHGLLGGGFLTGICLAVLGSMFSLQVVHAQICWNPITQQPIPCPGQSKHRKPTPIAPAVTPIPTLRPSPTATNSLEETATPLFSISTPSNKQDYAAMTCRAWPISLALGATIALLGIILLILRTLGGSYIATHELNHASLNSLDEYVEKGLDEAPRTNFLQRRFLAPSLALIAAGGLLAAGAGLGVLGILPCSWWLLPAGIGGLIFTTALFSLIKRKSDSPQLK